MDILQNTDASDPNYLDAVFINGAAPVVTDSAGVVAQRLRIRLRTFLGEWVFNTEYGVPYFQRILGKKVTKVAVDRIMQEQILSERGVVEIASFSSTLSRTREYSMQFRVRATNNQITDVIEISEVI